EVANLSDAATVTEAVGRWNQREHDAEMKVCMPGDVLMNDDIEGAPGAKLSRDPAGNSLGCVQHQLPQLGGAVPIFAIADFNSVQNGNVSIHYLAEHKSSADDYVLALNQVSPSVSVWL